MGGHTAVYRATNGLIGHRTPGMPPALLLDHVGAKSGTRRTSPLVYGRDGANFVLVASKGGYPKNPAWFHNLKAQSRHDGAGRLRTPRRARARRAGRGARALWKLMVGVYGGYEGYRRRTEREIPLVVLEPR